MWIGQPYRIRNSRMADAKLVCMAFVVTTDGVATIGECTLEGEAYPPAEIANGEPYAGNAVPSPTPIYRSTTPYPCLQLNSGEYVWGCEVMWMPIDRWERLLPKITKSFGAPTPLSVLAIRNADDFHEN